MKVRIDGPCFIETDDPFIITPIYVKQADRYPALDEAPITTPPPVTPEYTSERDYPYVCIDRACALRFVTARDRLDHYVEAHPNLLKPKPKTEPRRKRQAPRKAQRRHKMRCNFCLEVYLGASRSKYCSDKHRHAHFRQHGLKYPVSALTGADKVWFDALKPMRANG